MDLEEWLANPVTLSLISLLNEHKDAAKLVISECMLGASNVQDVDLFKIAQYKGQVHTLEQIIDLEDFLSEKVKTREV